MITTGVRRRVRGLMAVAAAAVLLTAFAAPAAAKGHSVFVGPPSVGGWYGGSVQGQILFHVSPAPTAPITAGEYQERIVSISCQVSGGLGQYDLPLLPRTIDTSVPFRIDSSFTSAGTTIACTATYERDVATCIPFAGCLLTGAYGFSGGTETATANLKVDTTPPVLDLPQPTPLPNPLGWYRTAGTVDWSGSDPLSGIDQCTIDVPFGGTDTASGQVVGGCRNNAGRTTNSTFLYKFDGTPPELAPSVEPGVIPVGGAAIATANATDAMSGIATESCDPVDTSTVGTHTVSCTATDNAGNTAPGSASYTVAYAFSGFSAPVDRTAVNVAKAGKTVPLKWRITDGNGAPITTLTSVDVRATGVACDLGETADQLEEYATDATGLRHLGDGYYQFNWKTPKTYASSCKVLHLDLGDGIDHTAEFRFTK
jgi:hypothetical protein